MLKKYITFAGILLIVFTSFLDYMIVNNALPSIQHTFQISLLNLQWLVNIYSIIMGGTLVLFGRLGDIFGYRRFFYWGSILVIFGSLGAGLVHQFSWLLFFRAIQSFGISTIIVLSPSLVQLIFRDNNIHKPMSIYSMMGGIGLMIGPYLGGIIVMYVGWRWIFLINIPILIVGLALCAPFLKKIEQELHNATIDWAGNILLLICLTALIYGLIREQSFGLDWIAIASFVICLISAPLLICVEQHKAHPCLNFHFFKQPDFILALLSNTLCGTFVLCGMFFSPLFLQTVLHYSPAASGTILLTFSFGTILFSMILGVVLKKISGQKLILLSLFSGIIMSLIYVSSFAFASIALGMIAFFLTGASLAINNTVSPVVATNSVGEKNAGAAIGTIFSIFNISSAVMLGITSVMLHALTQPDATITQAKFSYSMIFVFLTVCAIIFFILGLAAFNKQKVILN